MSRILSTKCLECHFSKNMETARSLGDEKTAMAFAKELMQLYIDAPECVASPHFGPGTAKLFTKYYGLPEDQYVQEKKESNAFVLARMDSLRSRVEAQPDPVWAGLQFAILGNYLDFSALKGQISYEYLDEMLSSALKMELDRNCYSQLCRDLETGKKLLFLTDNAGEIGFDRIWAEAIQKKYPHLAITFCVRGGPALNDATREDAAEVGVPFPIIDSGSQVGGTELDAIGQEARTAFDEADVIIAKGMGNCETMFGCGANVYYAFLVKCQMFVEQFQKPLMTPMFVRERQN